MKHFQGLAMRLVSDPKSPLLFSGQGQQQIA
jgi:hypothetical protein